MQSTRFLSAVWLFITACMFTTASFAQISNDGFDDPFGSQPEFLSPDEAFQFDFAQNGDQLVITLDIADGYYLYKKQFKTKLKDVELGEPSFPPAKQIEDEFFGISDVFYKQVVFSYPIIKAKEDGLVALRFQGCAEAGFCYPPTTMPIYLSEVSGEASVDSSSTGSRSEQFELADKLASKDGLLWTLFGFLGLGILLSFTPCVFPLYPILSGIVIGQGKEVKTSRAFWLSFTYVQGMAITYSILGVIVASAGVQFQAALQNPILLGAFIVVFIGLALAMFGVYELQLPCSWQQYLNNLSNNQKRGNMVGVFIMGMLSGLVASPCTTAPLTAILLYIAQHGDLFLGFIALYILSIGMGIPLILFGVTGGKLLPKAGAWMNVVKVTFGFMMLAVAILFLERIWVSEYTLLMYAALGLVTFSYYFVMNSNTPTTFMKGARTLVIFLGLFTSALVGYTVINQQLHPVQVTQMAGLQNTDVELDEKGHPSFVVVKSLADFEQKLADASAQGKSVMVDLYADWCVACKEFEAKTFPDPAVIDALSNTVWMQIDLTHNTTTDAEFQEHFFILGLPTILFFDSNGKEIEQSRVTGFMKADRFANHVNAILKN